MNLNNRFRITQDKRFSQRNIKTVAIDRRDASPTISLFPSSSDSKSRQPNVASTETCRSRESKSENAVKFRSVFSCKEGHVSLQPHIVLVYSNFTSE